MFAPAVHHSKRPHAVIYRLNELPRDFRRMLRVQWKEFIHYLDEAPQELVSRRPEQQPRKNIA